MEGVPGGSTGLMQRQLKSIGVSKDGQITCDYVFDAALIKEMRATEEQIAREMGQLMERKEYSIKRSWADFSTEELKALIEDGKAKMEPPIEITGEVVQ